MKKTWLKVLSLSVLPSALLISGCGNKPSPSASQDAASTSTDKGGDDSTTSLAQVTLSKIEVTKFPNKLEYEEGEFLDLTGMEVTATFSDSSTKIVTSECTTNKDGVALTANDKNFYVKYVYEGKTKSVAVTITVKAEEVPVAQEISYDHETESPWDHFSYPYDIVKTSDADLLFYTYYDSTTMRMDGAMELDYEEGSQDKGSFKYTEFNAIDPAVGVKIASVSGNWSIKESTMTFYTTLIEHMDGTAKLSSAGKESAEIIKTGDEISGLYFGSMLNSVDTFFGWGKTKESAFVESLATQYDHPASTVYMQRIENNVFANNLKTYYGSSEKVVASIAVETQPSRLKYYEGDTFSADGLTLVVTYEDTTKETITEGWTIDKEGALTLEDEKVTVSYGGKSVEIAIEVEAAPVEATLVSIKVEDAPKKLAFKAGEEKTLADLVNLSSLTVKGIYSDGSEKAITGAEVVDGDTLISLTSLTETGKSYTISYTEGEEDFSCTINDVSISYYAPIDVFKNSTATYSFFAYYTKGSNKINGALELTGDLESGTYSYYALATTSKGKIASGTYAVADGVMTFTGELSAFGGLGNAGAIGSGNTSATIVKDGDNLVGLNFGQMNTKIDANATGFFGYTATKDFTASLAEVYLDDENAVSIGYAAEKGALDLTNEKVAANIYYASVLD